MDVVDRVMAIMDALSAAPDGIGITELSRRTGIPKSAVYRLLQALSDSEWARKVPVSKKYGLGVGFAVLAARVDFGRYIASLAMEHLMALRDMLGQTVFLTGPVYDRCMCLACVPGTGSMKYFVDVGRVMPVHASAGALAVCAFQTSRTQQAMLDAADYEAYTPRTMTNPAQVRARIATIRENGYSICDEEMEEGIVAVSVPVLDRIGRAICSVSYLGLAPQIRRSLHEDLPRLLATANTIASELGSEAKRGTPSSGADTAFI